MRARDKFLFGLVIGLLSPFPVVGAERSPFPSIKPGSNFCFSREYDEVHLSRNPKQIVSSIRLMGRNAWRTRDASQNLDMSLWANLLDSSREFLMNGTCWPEDAEKHPFLRCKFFPSRPDLSDMIGQGLYLKDLGSGRIEVEATSDWRVIRTNKEPDGPYGRPSADDRVFILAVSPVSVCGFPREFWSQKGPTEKFFNSLP